MATVDERLVSLEVKVEEQSRSTTGLSEAIRQLDQKLDLRANALDHKLDRFREELSGRSDGLSGRMDGLDQKLDRRVDALDHKVDRFREELAGRIDGLSGRIDALDQKVDQRTDALSRELRQRTDTLDENMSRHFLFLLGAHVTTLVAIVAALLAR